ncbi:MAG: enoyl-CoA hydratase/isomerase family protein [Candidatus Heimdallarchaeaceae archaeon]
MSDEKLVQMEKVGEKNNIALISFHRQKALNSLNAQMLDELEEVLRSLQEDHEVRCAIITSEGKSFVAGADLKWMSSLNETNYNELIARGQEVFALIENLPFPVIAAVNGFALGGGMELTLACDIRLASENAVFGQPEVTLGLPPGWGGTFRLQLIAGLGVAKDLILTGRKISAAEAHRMNIVSEVYPPDQLKEKALELAETIAKNAPIAVREAKKALHLSLNDLVEKGYKNEQEGAKICFATNDLKEGIKALFEKRKPEFKGE